MEFRDVRPDQSAPFRAEIYFLDPSERRKALNEHFGNLYNLKITPSSDEEEDAVEDDESRLKTAESFFVALLADRIEFVKDDCFDQDALWDFFNTARSAKDTRMLGLLYSWMDELLGRFVAYGDPRTRREASTVEELSAELQPFIAAVDADEIGLGLPSLWPLVHHVEYEPLHSCVLIIRTDLILRIGMHSSLLQQGLFIF